MSKKNKNKVEIIELNESNIESYKHVYQKGSYESEEEYMDRLHRIVADLNKYNAQKAMEKQYKEKKHYIRRAIKKVAKFSTIVSLTTVAAGTAYVGVVKMGAHGAAAPIIEKGDGIQNDGYERNTAVEPGYYNSHPVKVSISNKFSDFDIDMLKGAVEYLDEEAKGVRFEISVDDMKKSDAPVKIYNVKGDNVSRRGVEDQAIAWAYMPLKNQKEIGTSVCIDTQKFHPFTVYATAVHELIHGVFGIMHSTDINSIMYPAVATWKLSKQDKININTVYPEGTVIEQNETASKNLSSEIKINAEVDEVFGVISNNLQQLAKNNSSSLDAYIKSCSTECEDYISKLFKMREKIDKLVKENPNLDREKLEKDVELRLETLTQKFYNRVAELPESSKGGKGSSGQLEDGYEMNN